MTPLRGGLYRRILRLFLFGRLGARGHFCTAVAEGLGLLCQHHPEKYFRPGDLSYHVVLLFLLHLMVRAGQFLFPQTTVVGHKYLYIYYRHAFLFRIIGSDGSVHQSIRQAIGPSENHRQSVAHPARTVELVAVLSAI